MSLGGHFSPDRTTKYAKHTKHLARPLAATKAELPQKTQKATKINDGDVELGILSWRVIFVFFVAILL